jgi:hypothetical protein
LMYAIPLKSSIWCLKIAVMGRGGA